MSHRNDKLQGGWPTSTNLATVGWCKIKGLAARIYLCLDWVAPLIRHEQCQNPKTTNRVTSNPNVRVCIRPNGVVDWFASAPHHTMHFPLTSIVPAIRIKGYYETFCKMCSTTASGQATQAGIAPLISAAAPPPPPPGPRIQLYILSFEPFPTLYVYVKWHVASTALYLSWHLALLAHSLVALHAYQLSAPSDLTWMHTDARLGSISHFTMWISLSDSRQQHCGVLDQFAACFNSHYRTEQLG